MVKKQKENPCNCKGKKKAINTINSISQVNKSSGVGFKKNSNTLNKLLIFLLKNLISIFLVLITILLLPVIILLVIFRVKISIPIKGLKIRVNNG